MRNHVSTKEPAGVVYHRPCARLVAAQRQPDAAAFLWQQGRGRAEVMSDQDSVPSCVHLDVAKILQTQMRVIEIDVIKRPKLVRMQHASIHAVNDAHVAA